MYTGENKLSDEIAEKIKEAFENGPSEEEIALDNKYTNIQTITNIVCSLLGFDEEKYNRYFNYKCENGIVWVYTDINHYISKNYTFNLVLKMTDLKKPLELMVADINNFGVENIAVFSFGIDGKCDIYTINDSDEERFEEVEEFLKMAEIIYDRIKNKIFDNLKS